MTKIGIVTYTSLYCNFTNYGTVLQAWALTHILSQIQLENKIVPVLVDYCPKAMRDMNPLNPMRNMWDIDPSTRGMCEEMLPEIRLNYEKVTAFYLTHFQMTSGSYTESTLDDIVGEGIRYFICGSDSIWDCTEFGIDKVFFADTNIMKQKSIAYAASFQDSFPMTYTRHHEELRRNLYHFRAIGLRDEQPIEALKKIVRGIQMESVLDPTLLLSAEDYEPITAERSIMEPYLLYYSRRYDSQMDAEVKRIAKKRNIRVIEISIRTTNQTEHLLRYDAGVEEFLSLVKNAEYVVTNSYHALIFCLIFHVDFCVFQREHCHQKILELLELVGLQARLFSAERESDIEGISFKDIDHRLEQKKNTSMDFLSNSLENLLRENT